MFELDMIERATYQAAIASAIALELTRDDDARYVAPYFVDYVKEWFLSNPRFGDTPQDRYQLLFEGGLRIVTTLDLRMQRAAEQAISSVLTEPGDPYGALSAIDPLSGYVRAMVGGRDYWNQDDPFARINLATGGSTGRQAGSAFKPFALVAALEHGISRTQSLNGSSAHILLQDGTYWDPENAEGGGYGTISLESATINSVNIAYANLLEVIGSGDPYAGAEATVEVASRMGIRCCPRTTEPNGPLAAVPSAVLGVNEVSTLEMASAYGTLAALGQHVQPTPVLSITMSDGTVIYQATAHPRQVVEPSIAAEAVDILTGVVSSGTGTGANIGRPQFGKTGTGQNASDAWFVGAIPQLATAVWVGFPQGQVPMCCGNVRISTVYGGTWPASIWHAFMAAASAPMEVRDFGEAPDVDYITLRIDVTQGCLANPYTPPFNVDTFQYVAGAEPTLQVCTQPTAFQQLPVPSVVGLQRDTAVSTLHGAGFATSVRVVESEERPGIVIAQDPAAGSRLVQTGTVTITVSAGLPDTSPQPDLVTIPNVLGMSRSAAVGALEGAGFDVSVSMSPECDPDDDGCDYRPGVVWDQSPVGGLQAEEGSRVTIVVNP
jgi:penicillin-binding protein 1A